jgi:hypothetical protein
MLSENPQNLLQHWNKDTMPKWSPTRDMVSLYYNKIYNYSLLQKPTQSISHFVIILPQWCRIPAHIVLFLP